MKIKMDKAITRRQFLRASAGAGAIALVAGCSSAFRWRALGDSTRSLRLIFYTDVHARTEWNTPVALERAAARMNEERVDFVLNGGDLIDGGFHGTEAEVLPRWDAYMRMHNAITSDVYSTIGNHDLIGVLPHDGTTPSADPRRTYRDRLSLDSTYYSFDAAGYHFIALDSIEFGENDRLPDGQWEYHGRIGPSQLEWLKSDLSTVSKGTPIVVTTHCPLMSVFHEALYGPTTAAKPNRVVVNSKDVLGLFAEHNLLLVLQGHLHVEELIRYRGTTFITGGAISANWWRGTRFGTEEGFGMVTLRPDSVEWEYVDYGWEAQRPRKTHSG